MKMNRSPILDMLEGYADAHPVRFHMPGHKGMVCDHDITEVMCGDDLHHPTTVIADGLERLSRFYGSARSYYLVNGSSGGIHAMVKYAAMRRSGPLIVCRNTHHSVFNACALFDVDVVVVEQPVRQGVPCFDETPILQAIQSYPDSCGILVTSPDYFGRVPMMDRIVDAARDRGILLLCDEAHGAHFAISDRLPASASAWADLWVQSAHKTLSAMTQSAYLHICETVDASRMDHLLRYLQTSSPNYLLVASLDQAVLDAALMEDAWTNRMERLWCLSDRINEMKHFTVCDDEWSQRCGYAAKDTTRWVVDVTDWGSGLVLSKALYQRFGIHFEMATFSHLVGIMTPWDHGSWDDRLADALTVMDREPQHNDWVPSMKRAGYQRIALARAFQMTGERVPLQDACGCIAQTAFGAYPPGTPVVLPGEVIDQPAIDYMVQSVEQGGTLFGVEQGKVYCINPDMWKSSDRSR